MTIAIFIGALIVAVMFHEFGHYITAKLSGMKVERFFFGFGPTLWSFRRGETEYGVKAIPAGGFVKIAGMSSFEAVADTDRGRTFHTKPAWKRTIVLAAGSATHFIVAIPLIFVALAFIGPWAATNSVALVTDDSPAEAAGLREGDVILAVDGQATAEFEEVRVLVGERPGRTVLLTVERGGERIDVPVTLADTVVEGERRGFLGVAPEWVQDRVPLGAAAVGTISGEYSVVRQTQLTIWGLGQAFSPEGLRAWLQSATEPGPRSPEGPVSLIGAAQVAQEFGRQGDVFWVIMILVNINIVLGLLNMLPLPPLDGGHLAVLGVEQSVNGVRRLRGLPGTWRIHPSTITPIALAVILLFVMLSITAIYIDITKPASQLLQ